MLLAAAAAPLPAQLHDSKTAEGWIWRQVQAGKPADLNDKCKGEKHDGEERAALCHLVAPDLLRALLTQPDLADHSPHGVLISHALINGNLDLQAAHIKATLVMLDASWIAGDALLTDSRLEGSLFLPDTAIEGNFVGERTFLAGGLFMRNVKFGGPVDLTDAQVSGQMSMGNASIADHQTFRAQRMHVGAGGLFMRNVKFGGPVDLRHAGQWSDEHG